VADLRVGARLRVSQPSPNDEKLVMRPQATRVLECLLRHAPDLVSKKDLLNEVWGHEALSESGVAQAIREIRKTLNEQASDPDIVGTRHGCGYYRALH